MPKVTITNNNQQSFKVYKMNAARTKVGGSDHTVTTNDSDVVVRAQKDEIIVIDDNDPETIPEHHVDGNATLDYPDDLNDLRDPKEGEAKITNDTGGKIYVKYDYQIPGVRYHLSAVFRGSDGQYAPGKEIADEDTEIIAVNNDGTIEIYNSAKKLAESQPAKDYSGKTYTVLGDW